MKALPIVFLIVTLSLITTACGSGEKSESHAGAASKAAPNAHFAFSADRLAQDVQYLASDKLGGRAPGSRGEEMAVTYLTEQYANIGLRPGNPDGTYVQNVPLYGATEVNSPALEVKSKQGELEFAYLRDFMCWTPRQEKHVAVDDAELVFVGYGIVAPEYGWDDYKGHDVSGKIIVMLVGDPPLPDSTMFGGRAMTYYGRWTYKYDIAAEKGAAGAIIVHNDEAAGYPWEVVANSWSGEQFDVVREDRGASRCALEGWITAPAATSLFKAAGMDLGSAYRRALSKDFEPVPMHLTASCAMECTSRNVRSHNVVALLPGNDPQLSHEYVIYTAHWDHLGIGNPVDGDSIYNGALDNASGVAATLEIARALAANRGELKRSVLFMNTTAEESGLLGACEYTEHPLYPLAQTVGEINIDGLNIWGRTEDMVVVGYGFSTLDDYLAKAIAPQGRHLEADAEPEKGYYYRSDHFPFAKEGVPSLYADSGIRYRNRPKNWGLEVKQEYTKERYHKPQDEYEASWDLSGAIEDVEALYQVGLMLATSADYPQWSAKSEFKHIREESLKSLKASR